ncbi:MAG: hypothetical protein II272_03840 [Oscillospiraceae bacterium]|nr:hypothetical protein [Oscillospiraceae bacterium]
MFRLFRKKKISELTESADLYVRQNLVPEVPSVKPAERSVAQVKFSKKDDGTVRPDIRYSIDDEDESRIQYSIRHYDEDEDPQGQQQKSGAKVLGDRYDPSAVAILMRNYQSETPSVSIRNALDRTTDKTFVETLSLHIHRKGLRDTEVYKAAQIDRRLFSKIMSDRDYAPSKDTVLALSFALHLSLPEATDLLRRAGFALSHSNKRDVIIEYFFRQGIYDLYTINQVLFHLDQKTLTK